MANPRVELFQENTRYLTDKELSFFKNFLEEPDLEKLANFLDLSKKDFAPIFKTAFLVKKKYISLKIHYRGLIEASNLCVKNCLYCGIRKGNKEVLRYTLKGQEILQTARRAWENGYGSIVIQAGERKDKKFIQFIADSISQIKEFSQHELGITLSLGEQSPDTYKLWKDSGADRYLLRIETSDPELYRKIHPKDHSFERRLECLHILRELNYLVGTGVMIGLPWQNNRSLAGDLLFFLRQKVPMVGMGPYLEHSKSPLLAQAPIPSSEDRFLTSLKMISLLRLLSPTINIASTTALQSIDPVGRELGIMAGANIVMPNISPVANRKNYQLYENKPCLDEDDKKCRDCLDLRIRSIQHTVGYFERGDRENS